MIKRYGFVKFFLLALDLISLILAYHISFWLRFKNLPEQMNLINFILFILSLPVWIIIFKDHQLYKHKIYITRADQMIIILRSILWGTCFLILVLFLFKLPFFQQSRLVVAYFFMASILFLFFFRIVLFVQFYPLFSKSVIIKRRALIVGTGKNAEILAASIVADGLSPIEIVGFLKGPNEDYHSNIIFSKPVLGPLKNITKIISDNPVDKIIMALDDVSYDDLLKSYDVCKKNGLPIIMGTDHFRIVSDKIGNNEYEVIDGITLHSNGPNILNNLIKRFVDITLSCIGLIVTIPLFLGIVIFVKCSSKGPVFFNQKRLGKNAIPFNFYKFRSMKVDGDDSLHREYLKLLIQDGKYINGKKGKKIFKIEDDSRVTTIGKVLRRTSLDELPQLFNVLKGEMSLVGPRPCLDYEYKMYKEWHKRRMAVLPGITGVWQVLGRSSVSFDEMVALDIYYIENWTPWLDLKLLFQTIPIVLYGQGAL